MLNPSEIQLTASSLFSAYASLAASIVLVKSIANNVIPSSVRTHLQSKILWLFTLSSSNLTIVVEELSGYIRNAVYDAAEVYLGTKVRPSSVRFKVNKTPRQKNISIGIEKNQTVIDEYKNVKLTWQCVFLEAQKGRPSRRFFELSFDKKFKEIVIDNYLPFVLDKSKEIKGRDKAVKLYTRDIQFARDAGDYGNTSGVWGSINLEHPSNFDTLAMDPEMKKMIIDDLDRFSKRKDYYKRVGKAWKRGYLLYGPPGTGKSSLIAAMTNYLNFDVYDLELTSIYSDSELRRILVSTTNRSIMVFEDIDCNVGMQDRQFGHKDSDSKLTLSGVLNFIDGLWSSCGDERIIIFTTNHKDKLDPALLRPRRMDVHIHMSYCTNNGFKLLASNYLNVSDDHRLFSEIEGLIENVQVTPAEVAEELMKNEDADIALGGIVNFLKRKRTEADDSKEENVCEIAENGIKDNAKRLRLK